MPRSSGVECMIIRISVVLPAPLGPMRPSIGRSPRTRSSTSTTTRPEKLLTAPWTRIRGRVDGRGVDDVSDHGSCLISLSRRMSPSRPSGRNSRTRISASAERRLPQHRDRLGVPLLRERQVGLDHDVEEPHGEDDADDRSPDARRAAQHQPHHGGEGDVDPEVADVEEVHHDPVHRTEQPHRRRGDGEQPELGPERRLPQAAGQRLVAAHGDQEAPVGRAVDPPDVEEDRDDDGGRDQQPEELVVLDAADVVREAEPAHAARATGEVVLGGRQDLDGGGEPERAHEHAVGVQVGDQPSDEEPGQRRRRGSRRRRRRGTAMGPRTASRP